MLTQRSLLAIFCVAVAATGSAGPVRAAVSGWTKAQGAQIRLLVDPAGAPSGAVWGAIQIALAPGWKTYWENPGDSGVPPKLDLPGSANIADAKLLFPAPERHVDNGLTWAGYEQPVSLPLRLKLERPGQPAQLRGSVFLGICKDICIPVEAHFDVRISADRQDVLAHTIVTAARSSLPPPASADFGLVSAARKGQQLVLEALVPGPDRPAELFISGGEALIVGTPVAVSPAAGERREFLVPITGGSDEKGGAGIPLSYTLIQDGQARTGEIATR